MGKLSSLLSKEPLTLIVRLSENSMEMAEAAQAAGAHAVVITIDPQQADKKDAIAIIKNLKIPVGIRIETNIGERELEGLVKLGIDFIDLPLSGIQENMFKSSGFDRVLALGPDYNAVDLTRLSEKPVEAVEAAVVIQEEWNKELTVGDLQQYITIAMSTNLPVIVPAQKSIRVSEVPIIWDTGAKGIMIGESITGDSPSSLKAVTAEFKSAIESIKE